MRGHDFLKACPRRPDLRVRRSERRVHDDFRTANDRIDWLLSKNGTQDGRGRKRGEEFAMPQFAMHPKRFMQLASGFRKSHLVEGDRCARRLEF